MQSDVAQRVVQALQVQLGVDEARALTKRPTENAEAYRLYLLGRYHFAKFTRAGWMNAIQYLEQALQVDPNYTLALCGLADTYRLGRRTNSAGQGSLGQRNGIGSKSPGA